MLSCKIYLSSDNHLSDRSIYEKIYVIANKNRMPDNTMLFDPLV
jgi:hypothetical protein